jgi:hypothetical protein
VDAATIAWLAGPVGRRVLAATRYDPHDPLRVVTTARAQGLDATQAAAVATQARLRDQARPRLGGRADAWLLTDEGAQQVSRPEVARHRADRYRATAPQSIVDLGCGLGSDLAALVEVAPATGVERDPTTAALAALNVPRATVVNDLVESYAAGRRWASGSAVFADPSRRAGGRRVLDPTRWSPPLGWVMALPVDDVGVKVAPGIDHDRVPDGWETEIVSADRDVVEAALYRGALRTPGVRRRATVLRRRIRDDPDAGVVSHSLTDRDLPGPASVGPLGAWLYEPDKAVIRAGLVGAVVPLVDGRLVDPRIAYVTSDRRVETPFATAFAVDEVVPFSVKRLRAAVHARGVGSVTVKKRGSAVDPDDLRRQLRLDPHATGHLVVLLTRIAGKPVAVLARPG